MTISINLILIFFGTSLAIMTSRFHFLNIPYFHTFFTLLYFFLILFVTWRSHKKNLSILKYLTLSFFPSYVILFSISNILDSTIKQFTLAIISFGLFAFLLYIINNLLPKKRKQHFLLKPIKKIEFVLILLFTIIFLTVSLFNISKQFLVDEPLWIFDHVEHYSDKILSGDLKHSTPHDKPGVPIAILSSFALLKYPHPSELKHNINPDTYMDLATRMRVPIVIFASFLLPLFYLIFKQLFSTRISILSYASISLSPLLIGLARTINPDSLLWIFVPLSILFFILSIHTNSRKIIIITGLLFGSAILTKYIANILFVFFIPIIFIYIILFFKKETFLPNLKKIFKTYFAISLIALELVFIFLPATWVYPKSLLTRTIWSQAFEPIWIPFLISISLLIYDIFFYKNSFTIQILNKISRYKKSTISLICYFYILSLIFILYSSHTHSIFDYQLSITSPKSSLKNVGFLGTFFSSFYVLYYGIHTFSLIGFISTFFFIKKETSALIQTTILSLSIFIPFYYIGSTISGVSSIMRYQIALYPLAFIISSYGLYKLFLLFNKKYLLALYLLYIGLLAISLWQVVPYYQNYNNHLLPTGDILNIKDMGDGSYQIAKYLNSFKNAKNLTIWADKNGVCAAFIGKCSTNVNLKLIEKNNIKFDYFVVSSTKKNIITKKANRELRKKHVPKNSIIFANLYKNKNLPIVYKITLNSNSSNEIKIINATKFINQKNNILQ